MPPQSWVKKHGSAKASAMWNQIRTRPKSAGRTTFGRKEIRRQLKQNKRIFDIAIKSPKLRSKRQILKLANNLFGRKSNIAKAHVRKFGFNQGIGPVAGGYRKPTKAYMEEVVMAEVSKALPKAPTKVKKPSKSLPKTPAKSKKPVLSDNFSSTAPSKVKRTAPKKAKNPDIMKKGSKV